MKTSLSLSAFLLLGITWMLSANSAEAARGTTTTNPPPTSGTIVKLVVSPL